METTCNLLTLSIGIILVYVAFGIYTAAWMCVIVGDLWMSSLMGGSIWKKLTCWLQILVFWPYIALKTWISISIEHSVRENQKIADRKMHW